MTRIARPTAASRLAKAGSEIPRWLGPEPEIQLTITGTVAHEDVLGELDF